MSRWLCILCLIFSCATASLAQQTITGTVTDPSGAAVANTPISVAHKETGTVVTGATSATGNFTIPQLAIGFHTLTVTAPGFKQFRRENIQLAAAQTFRMEIVLEIGTQTDSVTVSTTSSMMKTDSSAVTHNITVDEMKNLPLLPVNGGAEQTFANNGFRDPFAVAQMMPGVRYVASQVMVINGLPQGSVQYRVEGQVIGQAGNTAAITQITQPSVDAIEEVAITTSNYSAEFGSVGGALFNVTMKSGTNQYHGSVYDYAVNEVLNASDPSQHNKNVERRHDFGGTIGGPVYLPKIYDGKNKSFFFFSMEQFRLKQVVSVSPTVPYPAYRTGDFSSNPGVLQNTLLTVGTGPACVGTATTNCTRTYVDPLGRTFTAGLVFEPSSRRTVTCDTAVSAFCGSQGANIDVRDPMVGNKLAASTLDPVALAIQNYIPLPQGVAEDVRQNNYRVRSDTSRLSNLPSIKLDHNITSAARVSFYWQTTNTETPRGGTGGNDGLPEPITTNRGTHNKAPSMRLSYDHTLTPTLQLHLQAGWAASRLDNSTIVTNFNPLEEIGLRGTRMNRNFPAFGSTIGNASMQLGSMSAMGPTTQFVNLQRRPSGTATLTWIKGNHTVKGGGEWRMDVLPNQDFALTAGNFTSFQPSQSITWNPAVNAVTLSGQTIVGFGYANFLLGSVRGFNMQTPISYRTSKHQWGAYIQDSWRATRKLTLDLGLRWDLGTYTREDHGRNGALGLNEVNPSAGGRLGALIWESTCKCNFAKNYPYGVGPRVGFSYTLNPRTVLRGGVGVSYGSTGTFAGTATNNASLPAVPIGENGFYMRDGIPSSVNPQWPVYDPALNHPNNTLIAPPASLLDPNAGRPSRTYQWNLSLQREITRNMVIEASYVGNRGVWQSAGMQDLNALSVGLLGHYGFTVGDANDNTMLNKTVASLSTTEKSILQARGVVLPYAGFPTGQMLWQSLRPYPQYNAGITPASAPRGRSWYDSLQVQVNKRYSHGLLINANYTLAKNLESSSLADVFNPNYANKDISVNNLPQQIQVNFEYQVPRPASYIPVLGSRWISQAIGGWGVAMSLRYQSGAYIGRATNGSANPISRWLGGRGPGGAQLKRDANGNYLNPWSVDWTDYSGNRHTEPIDINCHCFDPEKNIVLNPNVWESIPDAQWAGEANRLPFFRGTRLPRESGNLSRNFKFGKDGRYALQVRVEFQNVFNRLLLPASPTLGAFNAAPTKQADGRYTQGFGTFGNLRGAGAFGAERSGVFVGRLTF